MNIIIFGAGRQAELTHYFFTHDSPRTVVAFCVESNYHTADRSRLFDLPVLRLEEDLDGYPPADYCFHVAIGRNRERAAVFRRLQERGYSFANFVSSRATVWPDLELGQNVFIGQATSIQPFVQIGDNSIILGSLIGHHTRIGSHVLLSCAAIGGGATVGDLTFIGLNAAVGDDVSIGRSNVIGAGCVLTHDTAEDSVYSNDATIKRKMSAARLRLF